jgi:DNA-binding CsgD family transcriptional regulator/tetratricopeptide (TPR) repeat protein
MAGAPGPEEAARIIRRVATRLSSPEFIGRSRERGLLRAALDSAIGGRARVVLVAGEAGIGKTRLLAETAAAARDREVLVLEGGSVDVGEGALPFGPLVEALRGLSRDCGPELVANLRGPSTAALGRLLPEFGDGTETEPSMLVQPEWLQSRIFEATLALLSTLAARWPVALLVEDAHWADRSTRDLLAFLARNLRTHRVLVLVTFRSDELHRRHPLVPWLSELERQPSVDRVDLKRFDRTEQRAQLAAILGHAPEEPLLATIHDRSDGNPFFAEELLAVSRPDEVAAASRDRGLLPTSIAGVLLARVARLPVTTQEVLGVAAVAGRRVRHDLLLAASGRPEPGVEAAVRDAIAAQLLVAETDDGEPAYAFRHALAREAVYDDLLPSERRRLHARIAQHLDARPRTGGATGARDLAEEAHHWAAAQVQHRALKASVAAGDAARDAFAFAEAARQYERALELWDVVPPDDRPSSVDESELSTRAAWAYGYAGDIGRAVEFARQAIRHTDATAAPLRAALLHARLGRLEWQAGELDDALRSYEAARGLLSDDATPRARAEILAGLAGILMLAGRFREAILAADEAIDAALVSGHRAIEGNAKNTKGVAMTFSGDCATGIALLEEALAIAEELQEPTDLGRAYSNLPTSLEACGDLDRAVALSLEGAEIARRVGTWQTFGIFHESNAAGMLLKLGRWDEAQELLDTREPFLSEGVHRLNHHLYAGMVRVLRGDPAAVGYIDKLISAIDRMRDVQFTGPGYEMLIVWEVSNGRPGAGADAAREAVRRMQHLEDRSYTFVLLGHGTMAEADRAEVARARRDDDELAAALAGGRAFVEAAHELATQSGLASLPEYRATVTWTDAEATRLEGRSDPEAWQAVIDAWAALGRPYLEAYAAYRWAEAALAARRARAEIEPVLRASAATLRRLRAAPLLALVEALGRRARIPLEDERLEDPSLAAAPDAADPGRVSEDVGAAALRAALDRYGLTAREREILGLVAAGLTNRLIAERLFISESTAGVHVSNILGKLGVASRVEAATLATRLGIEAPAPEVPA